MLLEKKAIAEVISFPKPDFIHSDDRGSLKQLVNSGWNQINVITSLADSFRGNHYHKNNREMFYIISGKFKLILEKNGQIFSFLIEADDFFIIEPYVIHSFEYIEDTTLIAAYDNGVVEGNSMDIYTK